MRTRVQNEEVLYADEPLIVVERADIETLKARADANRRRRARVCTHLSPHDPVHEMLIVHTHDTYVRPHKHHHKVESFHVVEGEGRIVLFDDDGQVTQVVRVGPYGSDRAFYYRLAEPRFHALLIDTPVIVFHEATSGPFRPEDTEWAAWSPADSDPEACIAYVEELRRAAMVRA